jgi:L-malate glycosyltransferase
MGHFIQMKKLLLIGSGSVHTYNFYRLIEGFFDRVRVITNRIIEGNEDMDIVQGDFTIKNPYSAIGNIRLIRRQIDRFRPDIIHVQQANSTAFLTLMANRKARVPVVVSAWGSDILERPFDSWILRRMVLYILKKGDGFTADAVCVADTMKALYPSLKGEILLANFGIEPFYKPVQKESIIYSNRLHQDLYRIDVVIRSFKRFIESQTDPWRLIIAGEDRETGNLKRLVKELKLDDVVEFIGWADKEANNAMYNRARIYVSIPKSDATAISLLEAMHAGCIPVVADLPASYEWIEDGVNGVIVKDVSENFFDRALQLNVEEVREINQKIIVEKGLKRVNREKFIGLYQNMLDT